MFQLRYAINELRRRLGRTVVTALGLAVGVSLVTGIIGVSQGLSEAQDDVLAPLQSVGTDILVTRVVGATSTTSATGDATGSSTTSTTAASQGGFFAGGGRGGQLNQADTTALVNENSNVVTDLSKLGNPGDKSTRDFFLSATLLSFPQDAVSQIAAIDGVSSAVGGLTQLASHQTGTVPQIVATLQTGGETVEQDVRPPEMTDAERAAFRECLAASGVTIGQRSSTDQGGATAGGPPPSGGGNDDAFQKCLPESQKQFRARLTTPLQTIQQAVNPPATDTTATSYTAAGIDATNTEQGVVTAKQLTEGRWISADSPNEVLISTAYASKNSLKVGSVIPINGTDYTVVGLVNPSLSGDTADVYFNLSKLQELAGKQDRVTQVMVKVNNAASVDSVVQQIKTALPGAQVVTAQELASQVTGSLADAKSLTDRLGGALGAIVLLAAFVIAMLLTLSSVSKRVREIGTLRAIGWSKSRVVRQILAETIGIGLLGGVLGVALGAAVCAAVGAFSPQFSATATGVSGLSGSTYSTLFNQSAQAVTKTTEVTLTAPLHASTIALGFGFALLGGVLAGVVGGWRAARLAPATALRNVG